jgi:hypothetical protein
MMMELSMKRYSCCLTNCIKCQNWFNCSNFKYQYFSKAIELLLSKINDFINTETMGSRDFSDYFFA